MSYASGFLKKYQWQCKQKQNIDTNDALFYVIVIYVCVLHKFQKNLSYKTFFQGTNPL